ncbi:MAG: glutamate 5-kinase [Opitutales bacterium]|nr:glutamate 5-kinase [Opitutales bacterium]
MPEDLSMSPLSSCRRVVLKLGTNILRLGDGTVNEERMAAVGKAVDNMRRAGIEIVIVSSGAIGLGMGKLGLEKRPSRVTELQACAAIGQTILMQTWQRSFEPFGTTVAQVLLTREDVRGRKRHLAVHDTLDRLLALGVVPIINENDTVSSDEIKFGDNDILSALVASLVKADLLAILSTAPGLIDREGTGQIVPVVHEITPQIRAMAGGSETSTSVGGMVTKLDAARLATTSGCTVFIGSGFDPAIVADMLKGKAVGTYFPAKDKGIDSRKRWIAFFESPQGTILTDTGAMKAVLEDGSSLLPKGVTGVDGNFEAGAVVNIRNNGDTFARGISSFSSAELLQVLGRDSDAIRQIFSGRKHCEAVHRDSLVLLQ